MNWGVNHDSFSDIIYPTSSTVYSFSSNRAEVTAMPVDCQELPKMEATGAMVEGDSYS